MAPRGQNATEFNMRDTQKWQLKEVTALFFHKTENPRVRSPGLLFETVSRSTVLFSWAQDGCSTSDITSTEQVEQEERQRQKVSASSHLFLPGKPGLSLKLHSVVFYVIRTLCPCHPYCPQQAESDPTVAHCPLLIYQANTL